MRCLIAFYHEYTIQNIFAVSIIASTVFHLDFSVVSGLKAAALLVKTGITLGVTIRGLAPFDQVSQKKPRNHVYEITSSLAANWRNGLLSGSVKSFKSILSVW